MVHCTAILKIASRHVAIAIVGVLMAQFPSAFAADHEDAANTAHAEPNRAKARLLGNDLQAPAFKVRLAALADKELTRLHETRSRLKRDVIGIGRGIEDTQSRIVMSSLAWTTATNGTRFTTLEFQSTDAAAVRLSLAPHGLPKGITLYVYGPSSDTVYGPFTSGNLFATSNPYWLPVVEGDMVRVELQATADADLESSTLIVPMLSHLVASMHGVWKNLNDLGDSGICNQDITCQPPSSPTWIALGQSVAKYYVTSVNGDTGACTGTLVTTAGGPSPPPNYFITAKHCVGTTADANSMHFYWFFQRATCGGANPTTVTETLGGATLIKTVPANDMTLVQLGKPPPAGTTAAPFNISQLSAGATVTVLHHPSGDVKKITVGTQQSFADYLSNTPSASGSHIRVLWNQSQGTTEPGSSGAAIFNAAGQVVGTLSGGTASCATQTSPDWFGRFDQAYPSLQPWLTPGAGGPPAPDATPVIDLVSSMPVSGSVALDAQVWYRIETQAGATNLTVTLTNLSADADVFVFRNVQDNSVAPSCFSDQINNANETCSVASPGAATWYIAVDGFRAATYTVTATVANSAPIAPIHNDSGGGGGAFGYVLLILLSALFVFQSLSLTVAKAVKEGIRWIMHASATSLAALVICTGCANTQDSSTATEQSKVHAIVLPAPDEAELATLRGGGKDQPYRVGAGRQVPATESRIALSALPWRKDEAGIYKTSISVQSTGARSIRVGLRLNSNVPGLELRFGGSTAVLRGSTIVSTSNKNVYWSPVLDSDTANIELAVNELPKKDTVLDVPAVSHIP